MTTHTMHPANLPSRPIKFTVSCLPTTSRLKPAPDTPLELPAAVTFPVFLQRDLNGVLSLREITSANSFFNVVRDIAQVADHAAGEALAAKLFRPLGEKARIVAIIDTIREEKRSAKPAEISTTAEAVSAPAAQPKILVAGPGEDPKDWCLFSLLKDRELEAQGLTLTDALALQLAEIHTGATWTAVYRTNKSFVVYPDNMDDPAAEEHWAGADSAPSNKGN